MNRTLRTITIAAVITAGFAVAALLGFLKTEAMGGVTLALCAMVLMHTSQVDGSKGSDRDKTL